MRELLVIKDVLLNAKIGGGLISGINEINSLAAGALAIFDDQNNMLTAANVVATLAAVPNKKSIFFAVGSGDATLGAKISQHAFRDPANVETKAYTAPAKHVVSVGLDTVGSMNIATPVAGTFAYLRLMDTSAKNTNLIKAERYEYEVKIGDTAALIVAGIIAKANANLASEYVVTVLGANVGFTVTSTLDHKTFEVGVGGIIADATIQKDGSNSSTLLVYGSGTSAEVLEMETEFSAEDGNTDRLFIANTWSKPSAVVTGETYDLFNIQWTQVHKNPINSNIVAEKEIIIAIPSAYATFIAATFATIIATAFGVLAHNSETGA